MVCPQCEIELQSKPDVGAVLGIEGKIDENLISEDWIKFYKAYPVEFCELCGLRLTFAQKIILRIIPEIKSALSCFTASIYKIYL